MRKNCFSKKKINTPPPPPEFFFPPNYNFFNVGNSMKREENMKFWRKKILKILFFSIFKKFIKNSNNIPSISKNYTAHPHDLVHVPAKFRENTAMRFWVTVRKLNVTDRQTDGRTDRQTDGWTGALQYLPSRAFGAAGDNNNMRMNMNRTYNYNQSIRVQLFIWMI